jgi:hypothetical protein
VSLLVLGLIWVFGVPAALVAGILLMQARTRSLMRRRAAWARAGNAESGHVVMLAADERSGSRRFVPARLRTPDAL